MTTRTQAAAFKRTRLIPKQFSLRALLILITITAGIVWLSIQPWGKGITPSAASRVKVGMKLGEVLEQLGLPEYGTAGNHRIYRVKVPIWSERDLFFDVGDTRGEVTSVFFFRDKDLADVLDAIHTIEPTSGPWTASGEAQ
jgi:hypothetical protein